MKKVSITFDMTELAVLQSACDHVIKEEQKIVEKFGLPRGVALSKALAVKRKISSAIVESEPDGFIKDIHRSMLED